MAKSPKTTYAEYQKTLGATLTALPSLIVIEGEDPFLRGAAITQLRRAFAEKFPDLSETVIYGGGSFDFGEVLNELGGDDLFAAEKLLVLRNAQDEIFPDKISKKTGDNLEGLATYFKNPQPARFCIVEVKKINAARVIGKVLNTGAVLTAPLLSGLREVETWLVAHAKTLGKNLDRSAIELLYTSHGNNLGALADELEKLSLYLGEEKNITLELTQQFMPDNEEFNFFELLNALEARDRQRALHFARLINEQGSRDAAGKLLARDVSAHIMLANCARRFEDLLRVRLALDGGARVDDIAQKLRQPPWLAQKLVAAAQKFTFGELTKIIDVIADELHRAHATGADVAWSLDKIVLATGK